MEKKFTIKEFKNYLMKCDSLGDASYFLSEEKIKEANIDEALTIDLLITRINKENLGLLNEIEMSNVYSLQEMIDWQERYQDEVSWDIFSKKWFKCDDCGNYKPEQCMCYTR